MMRDWNTRLKGRFVKGEPRPVIVEGDIVRVPLTMGKEAIVDLIDIDIVRDHLWLAHRGGGGDKYYACRREGGKRIFLHSAILTIPDGMFTDHINGDSLDCRRSNLRFVTRADNAKNRGPSKNNTTGYKGVYQHSSRKFFVAGIRINKKLIHLGCFTDAAEAHKVYLKAAAIHFGKFAREAP